MNTLTPVRPAKSLTSPTVPNRNRSAFIPGAVAVREVAARTALAPATTTSAPDVKHHLWTTRGLTEAQVARLLTLAQKDAITVGEENTARIRRLQVEAFGLAIALTSIVVAFAKLLLA